MDEPGDSTFPNWPEFRRLFAYDDLIGKVVQGRYEVERRLGAGGMGVVFLARHVHLDKPFALKIISPRFLDEPEIGRRFLQEARAASKIEHPNVVNITDFGPPEEGPAFFAMEYLEGEDLAHTLAREGPLPWPRVLTIAAQIARALAAAHQRGVIHRDIKPQNCLRVARDGNPDFIKVLDFGLAKVLTAANKSAWTVGGSPGYIAPEIYRGGRTDHRVDIFALGVVIHTLLVGRLPAQTPSDVTLPPGAPVLHEGDLPAPLRAVIRRATDEDPERRYPSAEALLGALEAARAALSGAPSAGLRRALAWTSGAGALAALVAIAGLAVAAGRGGTDEVAAASAGPSSSAPAPAIAPTPARTEPIASTSSSTPVVTATAAPPTGPTPVTDAASPEPTDGVSERAGPKAQVPSDSSAKETAPRPRRPAAFDEAAARALLLRHGAEARACKAGSTFRGVEATVRLTGTVTVTPRGAATVALPPGYDINPCLERLVAGLQFRASAAGGSFSYTFLL